MVTTYDHVIVTTLPRQIQLPEGPTATVTRAATALAGQQQLSFPPLWPPSGCGRPTSPTSRLRRLPGGAQVQDTGATRASAYRSPLIAAICVRAQTSQVTAIDNLRAAWVQGATNGYIRMQFLRAGDEPRNGART